MVFASEAQTAVEQQAKSLEQSQVAAQALAVLAEDANPEGVAGDHASQPLVSGDIGLVVPDAELTDYDQATLYGLKGEIVRRGVKAITGNLTVVGQTKAGYVSITKDPTASPTVAEM